MSTVKLKGQEALLEWCRAQTSTYGLSVTDFQRSWQDGLAFCALLHSFNPEYIPFSALKKESRRENLELAFKTAHSLGISQLLEVDDLLSDDPDSNSIISYISQYYHYFLNTKTQNTKNPATTELELDDEIGLPKTQNLCPLCSQPLAGEVVQANGSIYHLGCYTCQDCKQDLFGVESRSIDGRVYCENCALIQLSAPAQSNEDGETSPDDENPLESVVSTGPRLGGVAKSRPKGAKGRRPSQKKPNKDDRIRLEDEYLKRQEEEESRNATKPGALSRMESVEAEQMKANLPRKNLGGGGGGGNPLLNDIANRLVQRQQNTTNLSVFDDIEKKKTNAQAADQPQTELQKKLQRLKETKDKASSAPIVLGETKTTTNTNSNTTTNTNSSPNTNSSRSPSSTPTSPGQARPFKANGSSDLADSREASPYSSRIEQSLDRDQTPEPPASVMQMQNRLKASVRLDKVVSYRYEEQAMNMEGFLQKKEGGVLKSWSKRWITVRAPGMLLSFTSAPTCTPDKHDKYRASQPPTEMMSLHAVISISSSVPRDGIFVVASTDATWFLQAESTQVMELWINFLNTKVRESKMRSKDASKPVNVDDENSRIPPKEGMLQKREMAGWWRTYYFQVQDGFIYFSKAKGGKQQGKVALYQCEMKEYNWKRHPGSFMITSKNAEIVAKAEDESEMHKWLNAILLHKIAIEKVINTIAAEKTKVRG
eukprot:TRINITY_DN14000_c0_g1_i1.p1 TRINITY_DN14000_c0_g1~~TRINITY_DN14000_c0_g1_i1.p1  ORF type:complete len:725 (+),score=156.92 TRINITY_DN14000_c0_g1_i1:44-2176(+)